MLQKAMFKAVKDGDIVRVQELIEADLDLVHSVDGDGSTPLHWAAWKGHASIIHLLLDAGADIHAHNHNDHWGTTALHAAAHGNRKDAAAALIKRGADVKAVKASGAGTPLEETRVHNATSVAKLLIESGAKQ